MKKLLIILTLTANVVFVNAQDTRGTDFWLTFGEQSPTSAIPFDLGIRIVSGSQAAIGNIYFTDLGTSVPFFVAANQVFSYVLTESEKQAACSKTTGKNEHSVHITSNASITVYAINQHAVSTDATYILPTTVLGTNYYMISYIPRSIYSLNSLDIYAIIATQDGTQIYHNNTFVTTLNTGQVYCRTSYYDMTGAHITADKPIALFAMNECVNIPVNYIAADNLFEQLAPVNTWGKIFFVPASNILRDIVRIVASQDSTNITQTGGIVLSGNLTLNAGEFVELEVSLANNGCYVQADKPVGVCAYLTGFTYNSVITGDTVGDPAQAWLPPIEQMLTSALFAPFNSINSNTAIDSHYALIVTPTTTKNNTNVSVGGSVAVALSGGQWYDNTAAGMSFYSMPLSNNATDAYLFTNQAGLFIMGYGTGTAESYYYLASSAMRNLICSEFYEIYNDTICEGEIYNFFGRILSTSGTYTHTIAGIGIDECDTIITLQLTVIECPFEIDLSSEVPEICSGDKEFVIEYQSVGVEKLSVVFDEKARMAGFIDIVQQNTINQNITIPLPEDVRPDNYSAKIIFEGNGKTKEFPLAFTVLYSSNIIQQKWNNVLALLNQYYNGGYGFSAYEWYKNGTQIPNENFSYLYLGAGNILDFTAEYRARVTRADDNVTLFTCPFFPAQHEKIFDYPVIVLSENNIMIKISAKNARAFLWSVTGILLGEYQLHKGDNQIAAPKQQGVYILHISTEDRFIATEKIVVK